MYADVCVCECVSADVRDNGEGNVAVMSEGDKRLVEYRGVVVRW